MSETDRIYGIEEIREKSRGIFESIGFVKKAYLFGSYARQEATANSDLDFEIETNREVGIDFFGLYELLEQEFQKKVDVLTSNEAKALKSKRIEKEKILVYEQKKTETNSHIP